MGGWQRSYTLDRKRFASLILSDFQVALKVTHYHNFIIAHYRLVDEYSFEN